MNSLSAGSPCKKIPSSVAIIIYLNRKFAADVSDYLSYPSTKLNETIFDFLAVDWIEWIFKVPLL